MIKIDDLILIKSIGKGAYGEVFLTNKKGSKKQFATKKCAKNIVLKEKMKKYFSTELYILSHINHPNIIKFHEVKQTLNNFYLVFDYCNGGNLFNCLKKYMKINNNKPFTQEIVQYLMKQIVSCLQYLHSNKIIHRDLKLENILIDFENEEDKNNLNLLKCNVKIIDFGFARYLKNDSLANSLLGTYLNMDPQILNAIENKKNEKKNESFGYDEKADIWSLGTICYEMLMGSPLFNVNNYEDLKKKVDNGNYNIPNYLQLSIEAILFLNSMLQYDPNLRAEINSLAKHKFLTLDPKNFTPVNTNKIEQKFSDDKLILNAKYLKDSVFSIFEDWNENDNLENIDPNINNNEVVNSDDKKEIHENSVDDKKEIHEDSPEKLDKQLENLVINNENKNDNKKTISQKKNIKSTKKKKAKKI
jgi:serine/threonine protein kinase